MVWCNKKILKLLFLIVVSFIISSQTQATETHSPLETSDWETLTSHKEMVAYLKPLVESSSLVEMKSIGTSVSGNSIPALFFSQDDIFASQRDKKPVVLVMCQQHGNEPSSKEAALIVAQRLLNEDAGRLSERC